MASFFITTALLEKVKGSIDISVDLKLSKTTEINITIHTSVETPTNFKTEKPLLYEDHIENVIAKTVATRIFFISDIFEWKRENKLKQKV